MDTPPLDYAQRGPTERGRVIEVVLPFAALAASVVVVVVSFSRMDGERLFGEGGDQYFKARFPFSIVLGLAAAGAVCGAVGAVAAPRRRGIALWAVAGHVLWAAWWARHLLR